MTIENFWKIKKEIDVEAEKLGWNKPQCVAYIIKHYGKISRLVMSDEQLADLLNRLHILSGSQNTRQKSKTRKVQSRRRRK